MADPEGSPEQSKPYFASLVGSINEETSKGIHTLMDHLERETKHPRLVLALQTYGGGIGDAFSIHDRLYYSPLEIEIRVSGYCMSAGVLILQSASEGLRLSYPNARLMIHPASGVIQGSNLDDAAVQLGFMKSIEQAGIDVQAARCGMEPGEFYIQSRKLLFMTPEEALEFGRFGLIDRIIRKPTSVLIEPSRTEDVP